MSFGSGDALFSVGDLVARGPDGAGVLELVASVGGRAVQGNHERRLLEARAARDGGEPGRRLGASHTHLLETLAPHHWQMLEALPLWLDLSEHELRIVHAGLVPGMAMELQDPWVLTHIRTLDADGAPSDKRGATLWGERYLEGPHVVFGHNAVDGLQLHARATGLDTGCVYGNRLTALVLAAGARVPPEGERPDVMVSVRARRQYVDLR